MKKFIGVLFISIILCFAFISGTAFADSKEYFEINDNVYLFTRTYNNQTDVDSYTEVFVLPISYYGELIDQPDKYDPDYVKISYNGYVGWITASTFNTFNKKSNVENPYFTIEDLSIKSTVNLYEEASTSSISKKTLQQNETPTFISYIKKGNNTWYFVKTSDDVYGYIQSVYTNYETLPYKPYTDNNSGSNTTTVPENKPIIEFFSNMNNNLLNWILTVIIAVPVIAFCILIFKRKDHSYSNKTNVKEQPVNISNDDENDSQVYINK